MRATSSASIERNRERYEFLRWGQQAFDELPRRAARHGHRATRSTSSTWPRSSSVATQDGRRSPFPDTLVGTDSHTTMINGLGVLGWGVGGIEAEAVMLGQPLYMLTPEVVGFRLHGAAAARARPRPTWC